MNETVIFPLPVPYEQSNDVFSTNLLALTIASSTLLPTLLYLYHEYHAFLSLGPGGTPQTPAGFLKIFLLSFVTVSHPYTFPEDQLHGTAGKRYLHGLPLRRGTRPEVRGIAPQRQISQQGSHESYDLLEAAIDRLAATAPDLYVATSCFEKHSTGLFTLHPADCRSCGGEICHAHPSDGGSMHLTLAPEDVRAVLAAGWGERHPLARGGWFERFVPRGFVMVYAPRDAGEVEVVGRIVRAAGGFVRGGEIESARVGGVS